jgi:uracil-DNA glycosylase
MTTEAGKAYKESLLGHLVAEDWKNALAPEFVKTYFLQLCDSIAADSALHKVFPPVENVFEAFNLTPLESVKAVILGQGVLLSP